VYTVSTVCDCAHSVHTLCTSREIALNSTVKNDWLEEQCHEGEAFGRGTGLLIDKEVSVYVNKNKSAGQCWLSFPFIFLDSAWHCLPLIF
jgi:hypothetical protein